MMTEGEPPHNKSIRTMSGGTEAMKQLSSELREGEQSAIVVLEHDGSEGKFRGYISFKKGAIVEALYKATAKDGSTSSRSGKEALRRVWREALDPLVRMKVYSIEPREEEPKDAEGTDNMPATVTARKVKKLKSEGQEDAMVAQVTVWKEEGYAVDDLLEKMKAEDQNSFRIYMEYDAKIKRLKNLEGALKELEGRGFDGDFRRLSGLVKEPTKVAELELGMALLKRKAENRKSRQLPKQDTASDYDEVYSVIFGTESAGPADGKCPNCGAKMVSATCDICGHSIGPESNGATGLNTALNFDNFVVGSSNKFAYAACISIANSSPDQYNPLFIYSAPGLGKTHLLNAIGNQIREERRGYRVMYTGAEKLVDELIAPTKEKGDGYASTLRKLDLLLIDDIQLISGKDEAQNLLLGVMSSLLRDGKNVVVSGDMQPKDIQGLESQLVARLESGLLVDMRPPDMETRTRILEQKIREEKYQMPQSVLKFIAETVDDNIRELTGSLNRVVAYSTLMKIPPTVETAKRILKIAPQEQRKETKARIELRPGHGYLIEEDRANMCHLLVQEKLGENWIALDISRVNPTRLRTKFPGLEKARVVWLTDRESDREITLQPSLEKIEFEIRGFMESASRENTRAIVNIDDLQYVVSNTNFEGTVRLLRRTVDEMSERNSVLIISVGKETLAKQEIAILERELELIQ